MCPLIPSFVQRSFLHPFIRSLVQRSFVKRSFINSFSPKKTCIYQIFSLPLHHISSHHRRIIHILKTHTRMAHVETNVAIDSFQGKLKRNDRIVYRTCNGRTHAYAFDNTFHGTASESPIVPPAAPAVLADNPATSRHPSSAKYESVPLS